MYVPPYGTRTPREDQSNLAEILDDNRASLAHLLDLFPDDGGEINLDAFALAVFRLDPPAFLLKSVK